LGHELRNPIAAMAMASEALARLCGDAPDKKAMTDVIFRQARHAIRLLDTVLDVARIASGRLEVRRESIDLVAQVRATVSDWTSQVDSKRIDIRVEASVGPIWVEADAARLRQAICCLIENAARFTDAAGEVVVSVAVGGQPPQARVEVRDNGIGIEPAALASIFEPAVGRKPPRGGLGLGLTLARGLVELHGGSITAESEGLGKGACFRVLLPLAEGAFGQPAAGERLEGGRRSLRILIIDDTPDVVRSLEFLLKHAGHEVWAAFDGARGIEAARTVAPDVVLCDIGLPDMDGYAVARAIRADPSTAATYLIAVSGYGSDEDQRRSLDAGFDLHLNKPEGFVGLTERLASLPSASGRASGP
jgi:CheY-like chemotaxis protein